MYRNNKNASIICGSIEIEENFNHETLDAGIKYSKCHINNFISLADNETGTAINWTIRNLNKVQTCNDTFLKYKFNDFNFENSMMQKISTVKKTGNQNDLSIEGISIEEFTNNSTSASGSIIFQDVISMQNNNFSNKIEGINQKSFKKKDTILNNNGVIETKSKALEISTILKIKGDKSYKNGNNFQVEHISLKKN